MELLTDLFFVLLGMVITGRVSLADEPKFRYGWPEGRMENICLLMATFFAALDFSGLWTCFSFLAKSYYVSLEVVLNDCVVQASAKTFAAAIGSVWGGYWWIRLKALRRCIICPSYIYNTTECDQEPNWIPVMQFKLLSMNITGLPSSGGRCSHGCRTPPLYSYTHFVHVLPPLVFTLILGLLAAFIIARKTGGSGGGGGGGGISGGPGPCPKESPSCPGCPPNDSPSKKQKSPEEEECDNCGQTHRKDCCPEPQSSSSKETYKSFEESITDLDPESSLPQSTLDHLDKFMEEFQEQQKSPGPSSLNNTVYHTPSTLSFSTAPSSPTINTSDSPAASETVSRPRRTRRAAKENANRSKNLKRGLRKK